MGSLIQGIKGTKRITIRDSGGYVLLFSILISSIILSIGIGIANITTKSLALRSAGSDSQFAFYAADGGAECALLWDLKHPGFTIDTVFATSTFSNPPTSGVMCNGQDIAASWTISNTTANAAETQFTINLSGDTCAKVTVTKTSSGLNTQIISRGYNDGCVPDGSGGLKLGDFVRLLERAIRITF